jgi:hypothetical protein
LRQVSYSMLFKKISVSFFVVASSATARAPFSQYSAMPERSSSGSGHAQLGQSKPPFLLRWNNAFQPRTNPASLKVFFKLEMTAGTPAATFFISPRRRPVKVSGIFSRIVFFIFFHLSTS